MGSWGGGGGMGGPHPGLVVPGGGWEWGGNGGLHSGMGQGGAAEAPGELCVPDPPSPLPLPPPQDPPRADPPPRLRVRTLARLLGVHSNFLRGKVRLFLADACRR